MHTIHVSVTGWICDINTYGSLPLHSRILMAICRLQGDSDRVLFLAFDLLKKPVSINELPVFAAMACVWPMPLARKRGVKLLENRRVVLKGLEQQLLSYTLEVLVMNKLMSEEAKVHGKVSQYSFDTVLVVLNISGS